MKRSLVLAAILALAACAKPVPSGNVSTTDLIDNIHAWNGKIVTVEGWLGECAGYNCGIFPTLIDARVVASGDYQSDEWGDAMDRGLSIGSADGFDESAAHLQFERVILKARVNDQCWPANCTDRANVLEPISIEAAPLPTKAK
jgi:hypothetical protein